MPDEKDDYEYFFNGARFYAVLYELLNEIRRIDKYTEQSTMKIEDIRAKIYSLAEEHGVSEYL